jgi:hypothetical protein
MSRCRTKVAVQQIDSVTGYAEWILLLQRIALYVFAITRLSFPE